jgi:hypothetical protein
MSSLLSKFSTSLCCNFVTSESLNMFQDPSSLLQTLENKLRRHKRKSYAWKCPLSIAPVWKTIAYSENMQSRGSKERNQHHSKLQITCFLMHKRSHVEIQWIANDIIFLRVFPKQEKLAHMPKASFYLFGTETCASRT